MREKKLINVPFSGTGSVPLISIGGANKGVTYMRLETEYFKSFYVNDNADCIQIIFSNIDEDWIKDSEKRGFDLKKAIYATMKEVWQYPSQYSYEKCYCCFLEKKWKIWMGIVTLIPDGTISLKKRRTQTSH